MVELASPIQFNTWLAQSHRDKPHPLFVDYKDITLIGTTHGKRLPQRHIPWKDRPYKRLIKEAQAAVHLLHEGDVATYRDVREGNFGGDYEDVVYGIVFSNRGEAHTHPLEENVMEIDYLAQYGMDRQVAFLFSTTDVLMHFMPDFAQDQALIERLIPELIKDMEHFLDAQEVISRDRLSILVQDFARQILYVYIDSPVRAHAIMDKANSVFMMFYASIRDYETICPNAIELAESLERKKILMAGKNHLPNLSATFEGRPLPQPVDWQTYKNEIERECSRAAVLVENMARKAIDR